MLAAWPLVTRLFEPAEVGLAALIAAVASFWGRLACGRFDSAMLIAKTQSMVVRLTAVCLVLATLTALLAVASGVVLRSSSRLGFGPASNGQLGLMGLTVLGVGAFFVLRARCLRSHRFRDIRHATVLRGVGDAASRVAAGIAGAGATGLVAADAVCAWTAVGRLGVREAVGQTLRTLRRRPLALVAAARRFWRFPAVELPSTVLNVLAMQLPVPLMATAFGPQAAGFFALAHKLAAAPVSQVGGAISDVFFAEFGRLHREREAEQARALFFRFLWKLAIFALLPLLLWLLFAPTLFALIFGDRWRPAGVLASWMAIWMYGALVVGAVSRVVSVLQKQHVKLIYDLLLLTSITVSLVMLARSGASIEKVVAALSIGNFLAYCIYLVILVRCVVTGTRPAATPGPTP